MKNQENFFWGLIDGTPFLKNYLVEIESKTDLEKLIGELVGFYREVDLLVEDVLGEVEEELSYHEEELSFQLSELRRI